MRFCAVLCFVVVMASNLKSQDQTPSSAAKAQSVVARTFLEQQFETFLHGCIGETTLHTKGWFFGLPRHSIPAIPSLILTKNGGYLDKNIPAPPVIGNSLAVAFTYVIPNSAKASGAFDMTDPQRQLDVDHDRLEAMSDAPGSLVAYFSGFAYSDSCGELVNAAVQGNAGADFPLGNVKSMLSYQYDKKQNSRLVLAMGPFDSPLAIGKAPLPDSSRIYRDFLIWGWYSKNPSEMSNTNWLYNRLIGLALIQMTDATAESQLKGSVKLSIGAPFGSLDSSFSGQASESSNYKDWQYQTLPFLPIADSEYVALPSPDQLISDVEGIKLAPYSPPGLPHSGVTDTGILVAGQSYEFYQKISGLPVGWCESGQWPDDNIKQDSPPQTLATIEVKEAKQDDQDKSLCIFHLQLTPRQSIDPNTNPSMSVKFALQNTISSGVLKKTIALKGADFSINVSKSPQFIHLFPNAIPVPGGVVGKPGISSLQWTNSIAIDDSDNPVQSVTQPTVYMLTCGKSTTPLDGVTVAVAWQAQPNKLITMTGTYIASDPSQIDLHASPTVPCTLSVNLVFNMKNGPPITKTQEFSVNTYPPVAATPAPVALANPANSSAPGSSPGESKPSN